MALETRFLTAVIWTLLRLLRGFGSGFGRRIDSCIGCGLIAPQRIEHRLAKRDQALQQERAARLEEMLADKDALIEELEGMAARAEEGIETGGDRGARGGGAGYFG